MLIIVNEDVNFDLSRLFTDEDSLVMSAIPHHLTKGFFGNTMEELKENICAKKVRTLVKVDDETDAHYICSDGAFVCFIPLNWVNAPEGYFD